VRTPSTHYLIESREESLGEGTITGHPAMPEFKFNPGQVGDVRLSEIAEALKQAKFA